ncbi:MAG: hypothetical protein WDM85_12470 [Caulobacteraceae bacterium]
MPQALLDGDLNVVGLSASFSQTFEIDLDQAIGHSFLELGDGEWRVPQLRSLLELTISGSHRDRRLRDGSDTRGRGAAHAGDQRATRGVPPPAPARCCC